MGNRRVGRKRLYELEKAGQSVELDSGIGIKKAIISASQHRQGQEIVTEIAIDLAKSGAVINDGGGARAVVGKNGDASEITKLTVAKFGIITEIRAVVVEDIASATMDDLDLEYHASTRNAGVTLSTASILTGLTDKGVDNSTEYDNNVLSDKFLFLVDGKGGGNTSNEFTAGKILIYIYGFEAPADL